MLLYQRLDDGLQSMQGLVALLAGLQGQLVVEVVTLLLAFAGFLPGFLNPVAVLVNEALNLFLRQSKGSGDVHVAVFHDAHAEAAGATVGDLDSHEGEVRSERLCGDESAAVGLLLDGDTHGIVGQEVFYEFGPLDET